MGGKNGKGRYDYMRVISLMFIFSFCVVNGVVFLIYVCSMWFNLGDRSNWKVGLGGFDYIFINYFWFWYFGF